MVKVIIKRVLGRVKEIVKVIIKRVLLRRY